MPPDWQLTPQQEAFVTELFALCDRYHDHGVTCSSIGALQANDQRFYRLLAEIRLERSPNKKPPD